MTTLHLSVEEPTAPQRVEATEYSVRHAWHLTEFWRRERHPQTSQMHATPKAWAGELVELSVTQARWVMV
jgi:hypothetical protein